MPPERNDELKRQLGNMLAEQCIGVRQRRRLIEQRWLRSRRVWMNLELERHFRSSDSSPANYTIPAARRSLERSVVRGVKLLTPNVKWFEVTPMGTVSNSKLSNVDSYMWYLLRKKVKSRTNIAQLTRCMLMYGLCHQKTSVVVRNGQVWPEQRPVDPFAFYVFPETASTIEEADIIFEDFLVSYEKYTAKARFLGLDEIKRTELTKPDWPYHLVERLAYQGITDPTADVGSAIHNVEGQLERTNAGYVSITEIWTIKEDQLYQAYIVWNVRDQARCVGFIKSQYNEPLYRSTIHRSLPGETYTNAMMADIDELDNIQNDTFNQFMDAVDWEQGFTAVNTGVQGRTDSFKMKGRAKWEFSDDPRQAMQFLAPPITSTNQLRAWQILLGLINSLGGTGTIAEGQPGRNMPRAGNAVNNLINLGMADIQDVAELIEEEVLTPGLSDIYKVSSFIPTDQLIRIPGGQGLFGNILKKADIIGDYEFEWVGSLQFQDDAQRAQRLMIFLNMMPALTPILMQQGYAFNAVELIRMIWRYGLGERGLQDVVLPVEQLKIQTMEDLQGSSGTQNQGAAQQRVPGLGYNLPSVTNGFVQQ